MPVYGQIGGRLAVDVEGNYRTQNEFVRLLAGRCLHSQGGSSHVDRDKLRQCLLNSRLFRTVDVSVRKTRIVLNVKEQRTLMVVPVIHSQSDASYYGLFSIDRNFLGEGKRLLAGGALGDRGHTLLVSYDDPSIALSHWEGGGRFQHDMKDSIRYAGKKKRLGYFERRSQARIKFGRRVRLWWQVGLTSGYYQSRYDMLKPFNSKPDALSYTSYGAYLVYEHRDFKDYFYRGIKLAADVARRADSDIRSSRLQLDWQHGLFARQSLQLRARFLQLQHGQDVRDALKLGGQAGLRGVPSAGLWLQQAATLSWDYFIPMRKTQSITWVVGPFYDYARFKPYDESQTRSGQSYGLGLYSFTHRTGVQGVGIVVGHHKDFLGDFVSFSLGMGF